MKHVPTLQNGLTLAFSEFAYDRGVLENYVVTIGNVLTFSMMELFEVLPTVEKEVNSIARELAAQEAREEARHWAEVCEWFNSRRNG